MISKTRFIIISGLVILLAAMIYGSWFYYTNLRGVGPVFRDGDTAALDSLNSDPLTATADNQVFKNDPFLAPPGFRISVFAKNLKSPRDLELDPRGTVIVSIPEQGRIVALPEESGGSKADKIVDIVKNLNNPHGLVFDCNVNHCYLYVAEENQVSRFDYNIGDYSATNKTKMIDLPTGGRHTTRSIIKYRNGFLVSIGSSCNVCNEKDQRRATIQFFETEKRTPTTYATGLRNAVFLAENPNTKEVWVTEMGRDLLGDDLPPDEINIVKKGGNYGWPICYGKNIHDTDFDKNTYIRNPCQEPTELPSLIDLPAHAAPLGLAFFPESWGDKFKGSLLVAYHGSWNRTEPIGYKIVQFKTSDNNNTIEPEEDFIIGWLGKDKETSIGRPVDILIRDDKKIFISDDKAGVIYLVQYFE